MKRILCFCLAACVLFSFSACKSRLDVTEGFNSSSVIQGDLENEKQNISGEFAENTYKNSFVGIGCTLCDDWEFYNNQQMYELNSQLTGKENFYDMYAVHNDGRSSMSLRIEKFTDDSSDVGTALEKTVSGVADSFKEMGYTDVVYQLNKVKIDDDEFLGAETVAVYDDITLKEKYICIRCGEYLAYVTVTSVDEGIPELAVGSLFLLD